MGFDIRKKIIKPSCARHSQHQKYLAAQRLKCEKRFWRRQMFSGACLLIFSAVTIASLSFGQQAAGSSAYDLQSFAEEIRVKNLARQYTPLPVSEHDPKLDILMEYLKEKKSPLVNYAGELARMPNWKLILGIAHAESNLCKKTDKNNCWGIGPGSPWSYQDISESLHYVNYLIEKYRTLGMKDPETMVRTYVGHYSSNWVTAVHDIFFELSERGLQ